MAYKFNCEISHPLSDAKKPIGELVTNTHYKRICILSQLSRMVNLRLSEVYVEVPFEGRVTYSKVRMILDENSNPISLIVQGKTEYLAWIKVSQDYKISTINEYSYGHILERQRHQKIIEKRKLEGKSTTMKNIFTGETKY